MAATALTAALNMAVAPMALALPQGAKVVEGAATITQVSPDKLVINQTTDRVVIEYDSFDIGASETVQFIQINQLAEALNRVIGGGGASQILGELEANGAVILSNPAGIRFGPNARVDVAAIIATSADIPNHVFMAGSASNAVTTIAATATGRTFTYRDTDAVALGAVNSINGVTATTLNLQAGGALTQSQAITATNLSVNNTVADTTLTNSSNAVTNIAATATGQTFSYRDTDAVAIGAVNSINGVTAATVNLQSGGAITQAQAITATNLSVNNTAAATTLDNASNAVTTVAANATGQTFTYRDTDAVALGAVNSINGVTASTVNLTAGGALTQSQAVTALTLSVTNSGGATTLSNASNNATSFSASAAGQAVSYRDADTVNITGMNADTFSLAAGGNITSPGGGRAGSSSWQTSNGTTLNAGSNDITISSTVTAGQSFQLTAANATLSMQGATDLGASTLTGNLSVTTTDGAITDSGDLTVGGTATVQAGDSANRSSVLRDITLDSAGNDFATVVVSQAQNATLRDTNTFNMGNSTISGNLTTNTATAVTDTGTVTVSGTRTATIRNAVASTTGGTTETTRTAVNVATTQVGQQTRGASSSGGGPQNAAAPTPVAGTAPSPAQAALSTGTGVTPVEVNVFDRPFALFEVPTGAVGALGNIGAAIGNIWGAPVTVTPAAPGQGGGQGAGPDT